MLMGWPYHSFDCDLFHKGLCHPDSHLHPCPPLPAPDRPTTGYSARLAPSSVLFTVKFLAKRRAGRQDRAGRVSLPTGGAYPSVLALTGARELCLGARELCFGARELCLGARELCFGARELCFGARELCLCARDCLSTLLR